MRLWTGRVLLGLTLLVGCSGEDSGGGGEGDIITGVDVAPGEGDSAGVADTTTVEDTAPPQGDATPSDAPDRGPDTAVEDISGADDTSAADTSAADTASEDALAEDTVAPDPCGGCPEGWTCHDGAGDDGAPACVDLAVRHCDPCIDQVDCAHPDVLVRRVCCAACGL